MSVEIVRTMDVQVAVDGAACADRVDGYVFVGEDDGQPAGEVTLTVADASLATVSERIADHQCDAGVGDGLVEQAFPRQPQFGKRGACNGAAQGGQAVTTCQRQAVFMRDKGQDQQHLHRVRGR